MAVVGLTEVLSRARTIVKASRILKNVLKSHRPDLLILIDYPDFNLHIAGLAKRYKVPVLYYISPQVWAWRKGRVRKIGRRVDRMAVILPFEEAFYKIRGVRVDYVGHPLLDACPDGGGRERFLGKDAVGHPFPVVGLLPGSRTEEIRNLLPVMLGAADILRGHYPGIRFLLPVAPTIDPEFLRRFMPPESKDIEIVQKDVYGVLSRCHLALVTSGTATLEAAIMGIPMVIMYRISFMSFWVAKRVVKVNRIGLVNLVAGEDVVPELIQDEATALRAAREALIILENDRIREEMIRKLREVKAALGRGGASQRTARIAMEMTAESPGA
jgi:lipid-A-disaccharide synthase